MTARKALLGLAALALGAAACGGPAAPGAPPEIWLGEHECDRCRMIIGDERLASAAVSGEDVLRFDDLACLVAGLQARGGGDWRIWVHDYEGTGWLGAEEAWFADTEELVTPMGSGIAAFASAEDAGALVAASGGRVLRWEELME